jgi:RNA polymerase sigma-70 factor (ECF subfamily)
MRAAATYSSTGETEHDLVERIRIGDERALARLYDRWSRAVYALALRIINDADDAEEVLEDTFYYVWRHADRYEASRGTVATWVLTIARSRSLDRLRTQRRLREVPLSIDRSGDGAAKDVRPQLVASSDPSLGVEQSERRARVKAALDELPPEQREVLELAYFGGLSQTEIAERTGQPLGTVKTRTRLAGQKLRERLAAYRTNTSEAHQRREASAS